jgi:hypothetical protein
MHRRSLASSGEIFLDRDDKIAWLLAAEAGRTGDYTIAILAVTLCASLGQVLSVIIG